MHAEFHVINISFGRWIIVNIQEMKYNVFSSMRKVITCITLKMGMHLISAKSTDSHKFMYIWVGIFIFPECTSQSTLVNLDDWSESIIGCPKYIIEGIFFGYRGIPYIIFYIGLWA